MTIIDDSRLDGGFDGFIQICARHDDEGIAPAELENNLLNMSCRGNTDLNSRSLASCQGSGCHARIIENSINLLGRNQQRLERALGETGPQQDVLHFERALRHVRGMLQQSHVSGH